MSDRNSGFLLRRSPFFILFIVLLFVSSECLAAEDGVLFSFGSSSNLKITERSNVRVYENGTYQGLTYNESRAVLAYEGFSEGYSLYGGNYYVYEASKKDTRLIANPVNLNEYCEIKISDRGVYNLPEKELVPVLQSFPVFPDKEIKPGDRWRDFGIRIVDPANAGKYTRVKFYCEYVYEGIQEGSDGPVHVINAQYAMRYKPGDSAMNDPDLKQISGRHLVNIYIDESDQSSIFIRDKLDEQYLYFSGKTIEHSGFILTWYNDVLGIDRNELVRETKEKLEKIAVKEVEVVERDEGVSLSIQNLHFIPDSAEILPDEKGRIAAIYGILSDINPSKILVVGHTADIGTKQSQYELSEQRALTVINSLSEMGMNPSVFIYEGRGGDEPIADNSTEEGRAKNRRVELIILDD